MEITHKTDSSVLFESDGGTRTSTPSLKVPGTLNGLNDVRT